SKVTNRASNDSVSTSRLSLNLSYACNQVIHLLLFPPPNNQRRRPPSQAKGIQKFRWQRIGCLTCNASLHSNDLLQIEAYVIDFSASAKRCTPIRISSSLNAVLPRSKPWEFHSSMRNVDFICLLGSLYVSYFIQWLSIANMSI